MLCKPQFKVTLNMLIQVQRVMNIRSSLCMECSAYNQLATHKHNVFQKSVNPTKCLVLWFILIHNDEHSIV